MIPEKYLPIGTVVLLKGGQKRLMIIGFCVTDRDGNDTVKDYMGCFYPEGLFNVDKLLVFNHADIKTIYHYGLSDLEDTKFKNNLKEIMKNALDENGKLKNVKNDFPSIVS